MSDGCSRHCKKGRFYELKQGLGRDRISLITKGRWQEGPLLSISILRKTCKLKSPQCFKKLVEVNQNKESDSKQSDVPLSLALLWLPTNGVFLCSLTRNSFQRRNQTSSNIHMCARTCMHAYTQAMLVTMVSNRNLDFPNVRLNLYFRTSDNQCLL